LSWLLRLARAGYAGLDAVAGAGVKLRAGVKVGGLG